LWVSVFAVVPVVLHSLGAPLGEPFADDFDYLHRTLFQGVGSFFDGYGSTLYWRPFGRQIYFGALSHLIVSHPHAIVALHVALLAMTALLLYRAFRPSFSGPTAAAIATFPLGMESARMLIAWPSHFMDLGALLFAALAIHEASRRRLATTLAAMLASLLCKEVGAATALLLPWVPSARRDEAGARWRWVVACFGLVAIWASAYALACRSGGMVLPQSLDPATRATPMATRLFWAIGHSIRAALNLPAKPGHWDIWVLAAALVLMVYAVLAGARRGRLRALLPAIAWGGAWFLAATAALTQVFPAWAPYRAIYGGIGLGAAMVILCGNGHALALAGLVALRLATFAISPGPPARVTAAATEHGAAFDFERLVRLERLVRDVRVALRTHAPSLPHGARVGWRYLPRLSEYAFIGDKALQVWYRDTTLRWITAAEITAHPERPLATIVEFEPDRAMQAVIVEPEAWRRCMEAANLSKVGQFAAALTALDAADSLQRDRDADVFLGLINGMRGRLLVALDRYDEAEAAARAGMARWRENVVAPVRAGVRRLPERRSRGGHDPRRQRAALRARRCRSVAPQGQDPRSPGSERAVTSLSGSPAPPERYRRDLVAAARCAFGITSLSPLRVSENAITLMSTRPCASAAPRTMSSLMCACPFGQMTQIAPSGAMAARSAVSRFERRRSVHREEHHLRPLAGPTAGDRLGARSQLAQERGIVETDSAPRACPASHRACRAGCASNSRRWGLWKSLGSR
jgi:hypothetical protein